MALDLTNSSLFNFKSRKAIIAIAAYFVIFLFVVILNPVFPKLMVVLSVLLGVIAGTIKLSTFKAGEPIFIQSSATVETSRVLTLIRWGRIYIYFLAFSLVLLAILANSYPGSFILNLILGYTILAFFRELTTLKTSMAFEHAGSAARA